MKYITQVARILVGCLFILSGFVKLVDPKGLAYKLEEYFSPDVFDLPILASFSLELSVFLVILEVLLGVFLLFGFYKKFTLLSLSVLILFFTFLTFYTAYYNKVTDCGCFGDALKLKPWESFYKDLVLAFLILILWIGQKFIKPLFSSKINLGIGLIALIACAWIAYVGINHLPYIDFRAFAVGKNIPEGMRIPPNAKKDSLQITFTYELNGKMLEFTEKELSQIPSNATYVDRKDKLIQEGYQPPIKKDFSFDCATGNKTDYYMQQERLLLVVVPIVEQANSKGIQQINQLSQQLSKHNIVQVGAANGKVNDLTMNQCTMDATMLKTIIRSNPGILLLNKGTILAKYHYNDAPTAEEVLQVFNQN